MKKTILYLVLLALLPTAVQAKTFDNIGQFLADIIEIMFSIGGVLALIGLIVGGYKYITSAGNPEAAGQAKLTIVYSIVGLIVILVAVVFVRFLLTQLGIETGRFGLG